MISIVRLRRNFCIVGVVLWLLLNVLMCFVCINLSSSDPSNRVNSQFGSIFEETSQISFDKLCRSFREMEIINGIKFHAIISFDSFSHFSLCVFPAPLRNLRQLRGSEQWIPTKKKSQVLFKKDPWTDSFVVLSWVSFLFKTFKCHFYSFS